MTSESITTPQQAPRTVEGLTELSPFKLRVLMEKVGGVDTDEKKMAWHGLATREARVQYTLDCLLKWDKANGGTGAATNGVAHVDPVSAAMANGAPAVADVSQATVAAAAAATTADKPKRSPRTTSAGEQSTGDPNQSIERVIAALDRANEFQQKLLTELGQVTARLADVEKANAEQQLMIRALRDVGAWTLMAILASAQDASAEQLLGMAIEDSKLLAAMVDRATGKA